MRTKYIYKELLCFSICFFLLGLNLVSAQSNDSVTVFNFESLGDTAELDKYIPLSTKELTFLKKLEIDFIKEGALIYWKNSPDKHFICNGDEVLIYKNAKSIKLESIYLACIENGRVMHIGARQIIE